LGEAVLDVDVLRARPYSLVFALNNYRPPSIGEKAYDVSAQVRDLTGLGDSLDADVTGPIAFSGGIGYSLGWQVPIDRFGTLAGLSGTRSETVITEEPLAALDIRSTIEREELKLTQPLWRTLSQQFNLGVSVAHEINSTTLGDEQFSFLPGSSEGTTRALTVRLIPDYSFRSEHQYLGVRFTLLHAYLLDFPSGPVSYALPDQQYFVFTCQLHHLWDIAQTPFELESHATIQRADARISDLHALEIGGIDSVRGFRENELLASNAEIVNLDFRWLALRAGNSVRPGVTLGTFFDWAAGHDVGEPTDTFSSTGVSLRFKWTHVQADLAVAAPLVHPAFVSQEHGSWQDHGILMQIAATL
jgi:hemolysin activation/secretion protein